MPFPMKVCVICGEEFELKPDKPGYANRCPECSEPEAIQPAAESAVEAHDRTNAGDINAARRKAIRELLYRGDS